MHKYLNFLILIIFLSVETAHGSAWERQYPYPTPYTLNCIDGVSASIIYAGGENGTIIKCDGGQWVQLYDETTLVDNSNYELIAISTPAENELYALTADKLSYRNDDGWDHFSVYDLTGQIDDSLYFRDLITFPNNRAYAVCSQGKFIKFDGLQTTDLSQMINLTDENASAIWASSENDVYMVTYDGSIFHNTGETWEKLSYGEENIRFSDIWGSSPSDIFFLGSEGGTISSTSIILHYNGTGFTEHFRTSTDHLYAIWGTSASNVFAVCENGTILHFDGSDWEKTVTDTNIRLSNIWGVSENEIYASGGNIGSGESAIFTYNGAQWESIPSPGAYIYSVCGSLNSHLYALTSQNQIFQFDGTQWEVIKTFTDAEISEDDNIENIWGSPDSDIIYAVSSESCFRFDGTDWIKIYEFPEGLGSSDIWGVDATEFWTVSANGPVTHVNGLEWEVLAIREVDLLNAIAGESENSMFIVGEAGRIFHYNGSGVREMSSPTQNDLNALFYLSDSHVFTVGNGGTFLRYDGTKWDQVSTGISQDLNAIWGSSIQSIFAVGNDGTIIHYNGIVAEQLLSPTSESLMGIWGASESDIYAVGVDGTVLHFNGNDWRKINYGTSNCINDIWGASPDEMFAVGDGGIVLRKNGSNWSEIEKITDKNLLGIFGLSDSNILAVGENGVILRFIENGWQALESPTENNLNDIWYYSDSCAFAVGDNGTVLQYNGTEWLQLESPSTSHLLTVWGSSDSNFCVGGEDQTILKFDRGNWRTMKMDTPERNDSLYPITNARITDIWGSSESDMYATVTFTEYKTNFGSIYHYDGVRWKEIKQTGSFIPHRICAIDESNLFFLTFHWPYMNLGLLPDMIYRYDGSSWTYLIMDKIDVDAYSNIWGSTDENGINLYFVGDKGSIYKYLYEGQMWTESNDDPVDADNSDDSDDSDGSCFISSIFFP